MVRVGYKQTEVGEIPEDWDVKSVGDVCIKVQDGNYGESYPKANEFINFGIPFLTSKVLGKDGEIKQHKIDYISNEKHAFLKKAHIYIGDVLFTNRGASVGAIGFVTEKLGHGNIGPQLTLLRADNKIISSDFLYQSMKSGAVQKQILSQDSGSAMNFFGIKQTKRFLLSVPSLSDEQKEIAKALSDVDDLIASLEKLIAKKRDIKTATMQQLLTGKKRLPGFGEGKGCKQTELGQIPEDWNVKTYGDVFTFYTTASNSRDDLNENGLISYIHYGDIHTKWDITLDISKYNLPKIERDKFKGAVFIKDGDVIMADASEDYEGIGKSIEVNGLGETKVIAGLHTFLFRDNESIYAEGFRGYLHMIPAVKKSFDRLATGLKVYGISKNNLKTVFVPVPPKEEQEEIVDVLESMTNVIDSELNQLEKTKAIKQGMMQELLTGNTRLIKPEGGQS